MEETLAKIIGEAPGWIKKSKILADAVAQDYFEATGVKPEVMISKQLRKIIKRNGQESTPGHFLRVSIFRYGYEKFTSRKDAEKMKSVMGRSLTYRHYSGSAIKIETEDLGILETIKFLGVHLESPLTHTSEKFRVLTLSSNFGL